MSRLLYYYWLATVELMGSRRIKNIINHFGNPEEAWDGSFEEYCTVEGISANISERMIKRRDEGMLIKEIEGIYTKGIRIISIDDDEYPKRLREIYDPPYILYIKGKIKSNINNIGIVGSRQCTSYGRMTARNISKQLSEYNIGIISGLARGIDTEAHKGALDNSGYTCAVLGCGLDIAYPPENKKLMETISQSGAVISEYPPGTLPNGVNFPARNRIISGMSDAVIIVEASEKSGALITADFALEQGREVYAVPGSIFSNMSRGTNNLIKDGAHPLTALSDVLYGLGIDTAPYDHAEADNALEKREKQLLDIISDSPIYIDELSKRVSLRISDINSSLTTLELKGMIKILPGKYIVRI